MRAQIEFGGVMTAVVLSVSMQGVRADALAVGASKTTATSKAAETLKESTTTMKVKARLAAKHIVTLTTITVTDKDGIVWLSGTAPTSDASALAGEIARDTDGVVAVHNTIVVR